MYGKFRKHEFRRLSPRGMYQTSTAITKPIECTRSCLIAFWCWSYNLKRQAHPGHGPLLCEILSIHKYENETEEFKPSRDFDHFSIENACDDKPCKNGGSCKPLYIEDDFNCSCAQGFTGKRCQRDKDECTLGSHNCNSKATCINTHGSYNCTCNDGFQGDGVRSCKDVDECAVGKHSCHGDTECKNLDGSFECVCKSSGFTSDGNGGCADKDECTLGSHNCNSKATCINTHGSYNCTCNDGFQGDGVTSCKDVDECSDANPRCSNGTECKNLDGSFECVCKSGFTSDGNGGCEDINECTSGSGPNCHSNATCINTHGSYNCTCNEGFKEDGVHECKELDPCELCDQNAQCINGDKCRCNEHFIGNGKRCYNEDGDCKHLNISLGFKFNGLYRIRAESKKSYLAYCRMETEVGHYPWTVFLRRKKNGLSFDRNMSKYKHGFRKKAEFWLGLDALHEFSKKKDSELNLLVLMKDWEGNWAHANYTGFKVEGVKHPMTATFSSGGAGDSLSYHFGQNFSANEKDCGRSIGAGWWFKQCPPNTNPTPYWSNLNGRYLGKTRGNNGIIWSSFSGNLSLPYVEMAFQMAKLSASQGQ